MNRIVYPFMAFIVATSSACGREEAATPTAPPRETPPPASEIIVERTDTPAERPGTSIEVTTPEGGIKYEEKR